MTDEVEKVITMSISKMQESRSVRRGGGSLHKHLLISSVLTKARCAYLETWFDDSSSSSELTNSSSSQVPTTSSSSSDTIDCTDSTAATTMKALNDAENTIHLNDIDPRFFLQMENEIELPPDILNCVNAESAEMILQNVIVEDLGDVGGSTCTNTSSENAFSYLDMDQKPSENNASSNCSAKVKRQRGWSLEDTGSDDSDDENDDDDISSSAPSSFVTKAKRIRFSSTHSQSEPADVYSFKHQFDSSSSLSLTHPCTTTTTLPLDPFFSSFKSSSFRTKKSQFEVDEEVADGDDDSFLLDALADDDGTSNWVSGNLDKQKQDRRVPSSGSSSSGSSDEEHEQEQDRMEVEALTSLVQHIYFSTKQKHHQQGNLVRSLSTPDLTLCSRTAGSGAENNGTGSKNIFYKNQGTVLTMTV